MKRTLILFCLFCFLTRTGFSQSVQVVYDTKHTAAVLLNNTYRLAAEQTLISQTDTINDNTNEINSNMAKLAAAKLIVYQSLTEVNEVLKDGLEIKYIAEIISDIAELSSSISNSVIDDPEYVLLVTEAVSDLKLLGIELYGEITSFITKEGKDAMMDYEKRDELLRTITQRLQIIRGILYGLDRQIYYAGVFGFWNTVNPFSSYVNQDKIIIGDIMANFNYITQ